MSPLSRPKQTCLPLRVFCLLLLIVLILLLLASGGLIIHQARQIVGQGSHSYGQYKAEEVFLERSKRAHDQVWQLIASRKAQSDPEAWDKSIRQLKSLAMENQKLAPHIEPLLESLAVLKPIRLTQADLIKKLSQENPQNRAALIQNYGELEQQAEEHLKPLSHHTDDLLFGPDETHELSEQIKANVITAQFLENCVLLCLFGTLIYLALCLALGLKHVIRPLEAIRRYVGHLGTGVQLPSMPQSRVKVIAEICETLENLGLYLGQATVRSEKIASERSQFKRMSLYDGLTGLYNRRAFDDMLEKLWQSSRQQATPLGVIMMDVDKFKVYNDSLGHQAGDTCLREVGKAIAKAVRGNDVAARYGGEEFVVILPNTDSTQAMAAAERIRQSVESVKLPHPGSPTGPYVTISLGVTSEMIEGSGKASDLVQHADDALYFSKENGRNRATLFDGSQKSEEH